MLDDARASGYAGTIRVAQDGDRAVFRRGA